jgi:DNA mismatch repair protein MutL
VVGITGHWGSLKTTGIRSVYERLVLLMGASVRKRLVEVSYDYNGIQVSGHISSPDLTWPNRTRQWIAVNRRPVKNALLQKAVSDAFAEVVPRGRYPLCVLDIRLQKPGVDVNVHPQKWDVKVRDTSGLYQTVRRAIASQLQFQSPALVQTLEGNAPAPVGVFTQPDQLDSFRHQFWADQQAPSETMQAALWEGPAKADLPFEYWQLFNTYLVLKNVEGLWIFDQHAVHERILYAQIRARMAANTLGQPLLISEMMPLPADLYTIVEGAQDALGAAGFVLEPLGYGQIAVREVPAVLADVPVRELVTETLFRLRDTDQTDVDLGQTVDRIQMMSCKAAIKAGKPMTALEVRELIRDFYDTPANYTCPHGRPLVIRLEKADLERMFLRR